MLRRPHPALDPLPLAAALALATAQLRRYGSLTAYVPGNKRLRSRLITSPWGGLAFFFGSFFAMGGWRDGSIGFAFCPLKAGYFTQIACRLRELEQAALH